MLAVDGDNQQICGGRKRLDNIIRSMKDKRPKEGKLEFIQKRLETESDLHALIAQGKTITQGETEERSVVMDGSDKRWAICGLRTLTVAICHISGLIQTSSRHVWRPGIDNHQGISFESRKSVGQRGLLLPKVVEKRIPDEQICAKPRLDVELSPFDGRLVRISREGSSLVFSTYTSLPNDIARHRAVGMIYLAQYRRSTISSIGPCYKRY